MEIRLATEEDVPMLSVLLGTREWQNDLDLERGDVYVAVENGSITGCVQRIEIDQEALVLDLVLVSAGRRRQGIGKALVTAATSDSPHNVYLACRKDAVAFYEGLGFEVLPGGLGSAPRPVTLYWQAAGNRAPLGMIRRQR